MMRPKLRTLILAAALAILVMPAYWSGMTALNSSNNQSLPAAYTGRSSGPANEGGLQVNGALLDYLEPRTTGVKYLMAVPSSMQGADYVIATGRPVLYLGGFMGVDEVVTVEQLDAMVCRGELRYIYWDARQRGASNRSDISTWISAHCTLVQGFETSTVNAGAPDGTTPGSTGSDGQNRAWQGFAGMQQVSLYECACGQ